MTVDSIPAWKMETLTKEHTNEILDKISAEIDERWFEVRRDNIYTAEGLEMALEIISKYRWEGIENEQKGEQNEP